MRDNKNTLELLKAGVEWFRNQKCNEYPEVTEYEELSETYYEKYLFSIKMSKIKYLPKCMKCKEGIYSFYMTSFGLVCLMCPPRTPSI